MSSTYVHYAGGPGSLPNDYAILSRYAHDNASAQSVVADSTHDHDDDDEMTLPDGTSHETSSVKRRPSYPSTHLHPPKPSIASLPNSRVDELTPLLNGPSMPIPRIQETNDQDSINTMAMFWEELFILIRYTLPVFGTHLLEYSLVIASVVSIGHISTTALAASTLGSMTASVTAFSIIQGLTSTLDTLLPSAWTSSQPNLVGLWSQRMAVVMAVALIPMFMVFFNSEAILLALHQEPEVANLASIYLKWISIGLPAYAFNGISRRYFQSQGLFTVPTRIILCIAPVNALMNYLLVWGPEPIRLGFKGAPLATAISFNLVSICSIIYGVFFVPRTAWHPITKRSFTSLDIIVQLGLAGVGQTASEWWSWELIGLAASMLGPVALATQSVLLVSASSTFQAPFALSVATSVRIGNLLGEKNARRAGVAANTSIVLALAIAALCSAMFLIFRNSWAYIFNNDPEVISMVASILPLVALFQVFDGTSAVTAGILRARGKQFTGALLNVSAYYIIGIPFGLWLTFRRSLGLHGLWIGLTVSLIYCAGWGVYLALITDWSREVEKAEARLDMDKDDQHRPNQITAPQAMEA